MANHDEHAGTPLSFKDTLNLPRTDLPIKAQASINDPKILEKWSAENIYQETFNTHASSNRFILHDGPPYANGHIHLGSSYNKILKDIVGKSQRMFGKHVPITPGWDCHGLPIEFKVTQEFPGLSPQALKKQCRAYAQKWIDTQREEFKKLGVFMNWDHPYLTMDPYYEASTIRAFAQCFKDGFIHKKNKTVPWCASCKTVLASAEIEYYERKDPSLYVLFQLPKDIQHILAPQIKDHPLCLVVWTTTPWTLPLNRAVLLHPTASYSIVEVNGQYIIIGTNLIERLGTLLGVTPTIIASLQSKQLHGVQVEHPFIDGFQVPIIFDASVSLQDGTAAVHCAPGCGPEDYEVGVKNGLDIFCPVNESGIYTAGIMPQELEGMAVSDGQIWVIKKLVERNTLLHKSSIKHSYPHCWRCRNGLIFRATKQWFLDLAHEGLRKKALEALEKITFIPQGSKGFLQATLSGRLEWCISRQRVWGVPIVALLCKNCSHPFTSYELIEQVAQGVEKHGIEYWDDVALEDILTKNSSCGVCNSHEFIKEQDILDVWFDSGISHYAVLKNNKDLAYPADIYLEGLDQHRGWFQSSLLMSLILEKEPCMKNIITHGYTVDDKGRKMSKSLGNVVSPQEIIEKIGTDGLRLWAASIAIGNDPIVSPALLANIAEVHRKIRNTARFLLSNLYDFNAAHDMVSLDNLLSIDQYALEKLFHLNIAVQAAYEEMNFSGVFHQLADYCTQELSAFYLDIIKDRLYVEKADGDIRRSAQTVCFYILDTLCKLIAPILSFTAQDLADYYQKPQKNSIHLQTFNTLDEVWTMIERKAGQHNFLIDWYPYKAPIINTIDRIKTYDYYEQYEETWGLMKVIRSSVLKKLEDLREKEIIKHSLDAQLTISFHLDPAKQNLMKQLFADIEKQGQTVEQFMKEFFIVSQCTLTSKSIELHEVAELPGLYIDVARAEGEKCPRCWQYNKHPQKHNLCQRCSKIV